jgi:predicted permease
MLHGVPPAFRKEVSFHVSGMQDRQLRDYRTASWFLLACVTGLLLIACANVANLLLARSAARDEEFALRAALGAGRRRIVRQLLTESLLLASFGGIAGVGLSFLLLRALKALAPAGAVRIHDAAPDGRVLLFAIALTFASSLLLGLAPAARAASVTWLQGARSTGRGWRISQSLIALQIGLSVVLLSSAVLLLQSLWRMQHVALGMNVDDVHTVRIQLGAQRYGTSEKTSAFFEQALERLSRIPGTRVAALSDSVPLYGGSRTTIFSAIDVEGRPVDSRRPTGGMVVWRLVTPEYFTTMGVPVVRGRCFTPEDRVGTEELTIVDEVLARRLFAGEDPIGKRIRPGRSGPFRTIIGVSRPAKNAGLTQQDDPEYYNLWRMRSPLEGNRAHILLRSDADPAEVASFVRAEIGRMDATVPVSVTTMEGNLAKLTERPKVQTRLLAGFALIGLLLAAVGQFGLVSFIVTHRTAEIGIRIALGATPGDVLRLIGSQVMAWTAAGALAGIVATAWLGRFAQPLLFGISAHDPGTAILVVLILGTVSIAAVVPPALRAIQVQPATALRHE